MSRSGNEPEPPQREVRTLEKSHSNSLLIASWKIYIWVRNQWRMLTWTALGCRLIIICKASAKHHLAAKTSTLASFHCQTGQIKLGPPLWRDLTKVIFVQNLRSQDWQSRPGFESGPPWWRQHSRKEPLEQLNNSYLEHLRTYQRATNGKCLRQFLNFDNLFRFWCPPLCFYYIYFISFSFAGMRLVNYEEATKRRSTLCRLPSFPLLFYRYLEKVINYPCHLYILWYSPSTFNNVLIFLILFKKWTPTTSWTLSGYAIMNHCSDFKIRSWRKSILIWCLTIPSHWDEEY